MNPSFMSGWCGWRRLRVDRAAEKVILSFATTRSRLCGQLSVWVYAWLCGARTEGVDWGGGGFDGWFNSPYSITYSTYVLAIITGDNRGHNARRHLTSHLAAKLCSCYTLCKSVIPHRWLPYCFLPTRARYALFTRWVYLTVMKFYRCHAPFSAVSITLTQFLYKLKDTRNTQLSMQD